jgi:putative transposase
LTSTSDKVIVRSGCLCYTNYVEDDVSELIRMSNSQDLIEENGTIRLSDAVWAEARRRADVIRTIAAQENVAAIVAAEAAQKLGLSERTIYRLVRRWRESGGSLPALVPTSPIGGKGKGRLSENVERIIIAAISDFYLSKQRVGINYLMTVIRAECRKGGSPPPLHQYCAIEN